MHGTYLLNMFPIKIQQLPTGCLNVGVDDLSGEDSAVIL